MTQQNPWKLENLKSNLLKNRDAVVIFGDKAVEELNLYKIDEKSKKDFNKKKMVKHPKAFWEFYLDNIAVNLNESNAGKSLCELIKTGTIKTIIDLNYNGEIVPVFGSTTRVINLKGVGDIFRCMSCDKNIHVLDNESISSNKVLKCECGGKIAPTVTMFGEKYLEKHTKAIKEAIFKEEDGEVKLNTHCLIFVGVDFEEDYMHELIESYSAIKMEVSTDEDPHFLVMITEKDGASIQYYQPEFATHEDIANSLKRLKDML